jgi:hypothetical protein
MDPSEEEETSGKAAAPEPAQEVTVAANAWAVLPFGAAFAVSTNVRFFTAKQS